MPGGGVRVACFHVAEAWIDLGVAGFALDQRQHLAAFDHDEIDFAAARVAEIAQFDIAPFEVCGRVDGKTVQLWAKDADGALAMEATAVLA